jgi:hypothetical protein
VPARHAPRCLVALEPPLVSPLASATLGHRDTDGQVSSDVYSAVCRYNLGLLPTPVRALRASWSRELRVRDLDAPSSFAYTRHAPALFSGCRPSLFNLPPPRHPACFSIVFFCWLRRLIVSFTDLPSLWTFRARPHRETAFPGHIAATDLRFVSWLTTPMHSLRGPEPHDAHKQDTALPTEV